MHRRSTLTTATLAPLWLLFLALFVCVALQAKSYDVAVGVANEPPAQSSAEAR